MPGEMSDARRVLPSIDGLLADDRTRAWQERWGREPVKLALREALAEARARLAEAPGVSVAAEELLSAARVQLELANRGSLRPVLNGTGVVLHTNLGRAPLSGEALRALAVAEGYSNLEYDVETGGRGSRYDHCAALVAELAGSEAALVVNNNAAAVSLAVNELAFERDVLVSRGELVEIGGSFRMPDVIARSGARLVEIGTTNRTRIEDYREALSERTGAIMKVHPSNYTVEGFVSTVLIEELVELGHSAGVPVVHDVGSGLLSQELLPEFPDEPTVGDSVTAGVDLVTWSGDKLMGGPQAGLIAGSAAWITRLRKNPLLRAFRVDKLTLAALEATLRIYRDPRLAAERVPALRMLRTDVGLLERRAGGVRDELSVPPAVTVEVVGMESLVGGGSFPGFGIPSSGLSIRGLDVDALDSRCRAGDPPLVGRVEQGAFLIDLRTIEPSDDVSLVARLETALAAVGVSDG